MGTGGRGRRVLLCAAVAGFASISYGMSVVLDPAAPAPVPTGEVIHFTAAAMDGGEGTLWYRFRARALGGDYHVIRDYGPLSTLDWTEADYDGGYEVEVSARNLASGESASTSAAVEFLSNALDQAVVRATANPLVFLYSAPPCRTGERMRAEFQGPGGALQHTPWKECRSGVSMNFYLAGLRANTTYQASYRVQSGATARPVSRVSFTTGGEFALYSDTILSGGPLPESDTFLLGSALGTAAAAHDMSGHPVWFAPGGVVSFLTRPEPGGVFWGILEDGALDASRQFVRKIDLAGNILLETNAARVSEQLVAQGKRAITGFHHEARTLSDGRILVLASSEQILTDVQGPGAVDILGDMVVVLDADLNVVWSWDAFEHLDVTRRAILKETCAQGNAGCPPHPLAPVANDWLHGNSLQETADGNLLYSSRHQDWLIKIAYQGGQGDGRVLWRLGKDGDFQFLSADPFPWFTHQHDGNFDLSNPSTLLVYDDGNTRVAAQGQGNSRGQVFHIDEQNRTATPILNVDLGVYSQAVGSAQQLRNGDVHFDSGFVAEANGIDSYSVEADPAGDIVYAAQANVILYRSFRMSDMYTPN